MSCCGTPRHAPSESLCSNRPPPPPSSRPITSAPLPLSPPSFSPNPTPTPEEILSPPPQAHLSPSPTSFPHSFSPSPSLSGRSSVVYSPTFHIARPTPTYPGQNQDQNQHFPPGAGSLPRAQAREVPQAADESRLSVAIDLGTTLSGVAYASPLHTSNAIQQVLHWPGSSETFRKIPTCLVYSPEGDVLAWGLEAKLHIPDAHVCKCEWFKLYLEPAALQDGTVHDRLPPLPPNKQPIDLITDYLSALWVHAKKQITAQTSAVASLDAAHVWLTVPAAWDAKGCNLMREAALTAGLVKSSRPGEPEEEWMGRLRIITEPEAAAVHCAQLTDVHKLKPSQNLLICDAGGGTVDLAVYKLLGNLRNLEIAELCTRSGSNCGSIFLDTRFVELVQHLLRDHPAHTDALSLANFQACFSETDKLAYRGAEDDDTNFIFTCFNVEDPDDPSIGLENGELSIPGRVLRREVFDPIVNEVLDLIAKQLSKAGQPVHALLLVGGFAGSSYLFKRVEDTFGGRISVIARPPDCDVATLQGAARYGLSNRSVVSSVIAPRSYIMRVKLPAEQEDYGKRPAYIIQNNVGVTVCENRLQYLVQKGAILRKGQRVVHPFCKFAKDPGDKIFSAILYTSDADRIMRYTDEGETTELCKWSVDLSNIPTFQQAAQRWYSTREGFYVEFELGLELDSAEIRGYLMWRGCEIGAVWFEFLS